MNRWVLLVGLVLSGCAESGAVCVPGQVVTCPGSGGCAGSQVCSEDGTAYGECVCSGAKSLPGEACASNDECTQPYVCIKKTCQRCGPENCFGACNGFTGACIPRDSGR